MQSEKGRVSGKCYPEIVIVSSEMTTIMMFHIEWPWCGNEAFCPLVA